MIPILYLGAPGIGKTAKVRARYDHCEILLLSSCCEEDIAGLPYRENDKEKRTIPRFAENINAIPKNKTVCLFLDEIDKARREVADTLLTLITNPRHFNINRDIEIIAAANPPEWGGGDGISKAMQSRFAIVEEGVDLVAWEEWARNEYKDIRIARCIDMIIRKEIPILESNGEGYDFRLTCPRTIELAWKCLLQKKDNLISGLVTTNAATGMLMAFSQDEKNIETQTISRSIGSSAFKAANKIFRGAM